MEQGVLGPAPAGGSLTVRVECWTSAYTMGEPHEVTVAADWTVHMPHDLEAERVGVAFGGYSSCLRFVDQTVPAFRAVLELLTRRRRPNLSARRPGAWQIVRPDSVPGCCAGVSFPSAAKAARHARSASHFATAHAVDREQLAALVAAAEVAWRSWAEASIRGDDGVESLVREVGGVSDLWQAGITPADIMHLASYAPVGDRLPVEYYVSLAYGSVDPGWLCGVIRHRPDADLAAWLAGRDRPQDRVPADPLGRLLAVGLPRQGALELAQRGISPELPRAIAETTGWSVPTAARTLLSWTLADCEPDLDDYRLLAQVGPGDPWLSPAAATEIHKQVRDYAARTLHEPVTAVSRTDAALLLVILGNRFEVLAALRSGVRRARDLAGAPSAESSRREPTTTQGVR